MSEKTPNLLIDQLLSYTAPEDIGLSAGHAGEREKPNILIGELLSYAAPEDIGLDPVS